ncbi:MAG: choice-of-anchor D domain-containing protein, partial [Deltaproteobacteria bacterium]|nr:choice-of-anchor D domain-containing protein [Deltaproteobacteria bacterium]
ILDGKGDGTILDIDTTGLGSDVNTTVIISNMTITNSGSTAVDIDTNDANVEIKDSVFSFNYRSGDVGALSVNINASGKIILQNNLFANNRVSDDVAAVDFSTDTGSIFVDRNQFITNAADDDTGAFEVSSSTGAITFSNNICKNNASADGAGCGEIFSDGPITVANNTITDNSSTGFAGGLDVESNSTETMLLVNNLIANNHGANDTGGGVYIYTDIGKVILVNNTITGNSNYDGGGLYIEAYDPTQASVFLYNNIIFSNNGIDGKDIYFNDNDFDGLTGASITLVNNDFSDFHSDCQEDTSTPCVPNITLQNNLDLDPLFANAAAGDFHLQNASPVLNKGDNSAPNLPATDLDGNPRVVSGTVDMGAYEANSTALSVSPSVLTFPDLEEGKSSELLITITNNGVQSVTFTEMTLSDTTNYSLNFAGGTCGSATVTLDAGKSCTIAVVSSPKTEGLKVATLILKSNSASHPELTVSIFGAGVGGFAGVSGSGCSMSPAALPTSTAWIYGMIPALLMVVRRMKK